MPFKRGLWLILEDHAGEATPIACEVVERRPDLWVLEGLVPPQVYPVTFVSAHLRLDGEHLGRLSLASPLITVTHQPMDVKLEIPVKPEAVEKAARKSPALAR